MFRLRKVENIKYKLYVAEAFGIGNLSSWGFSNHELDDSYFEARSSVTLDLRCECFTLEFQIQSKTDSQFKVC